MFSNHSVAGEGISKYHLLLSFHGRCMRCWIYCQILLINAWIKKQIFNSYHNFVFKYFDNYISVKLGFVLIIYCILSTSKQSWGGGRFKGFTRCKRLRTPGTQAPLPINPFSQCNHYPQCSVCSLHPFKWTHIYITI